MLIAGDRIVKNTIANRRGGDRSPPVAFLVSLHECINGPLKGKNKIGRGEREKKRIVHAAANIPSN